jgi:hypothetical protein
MTRSHRMHDESALRILVLFTDFLITAELGYWAPDQLSTPKSFCLSFGLIRRRPRGFADRQIQPG